MASLSALKRGMATTLFLVWLFLFILIGAIALLLLPKNAGIYGWVAILFLTLLFILLQWAIGPSVVAWSTRLRYLRRGENPFLESMVTELCQKSNVPMPRLAVVNDPIPNAFVFGRTLNSATLAVHTGLLERLNNNEIKAVLGHEIGHLKHRDVIIMTIAGAIPLLAYMIAYMFFFGGRGARREGGALLLALAALAFAIYFITFLLVKRLSRLREYYADSYSAFVTMNPHGLSSALTKITYGLSLSKEESAGARAFYIGDPISAKMEISSIMQKRHQYDLDGDGVLDEYELEKAMEAEARTRWRGWNEMSSTHPPTFKRILQLKQIEEDIKASGELGGNIYKHI